MVSKILSLGIELPPDVPETILLFKYGDTEYSGENGQKSKYTFLEYDADRLIQDLQSGGVDMMVDYNHQQLRAAKNGQPAPAAGWITALEKLDDGLYAKIRWTPKAAEMIANKEYRYTSPTFFLTDDGRVAQLYNLALTNKPATVNCPALVAAELQPILTNREVTMDEKLCKLLSLEASATPTDAEARIAKLVELEQGVTALKNDLQTALATTDPVALEAVPGLVANLTEKAKTADQLQEKVTSLEKDLDGFEREKVIADGLANGQLCNAQLTMLEAKTTAEIKAVKEATPKGTYPLPGKTAAAKPAEKMDDVLTDEDKKTARLMGLSEDEFKQTKGRNVGLVG